MDKLEGNLTFFRDMFPDARIIVFGYGKKTFLTAEPETISEYLIGPIPGPAVIQLVALSVMPDEAYGKDDTVKVTLTDSGYHALSDFIWNDLVKDEQGKPILVAPSKNPEGLYYAAMSEYNLLHTCNTWVADALHHSGLQVEGDGVIFSGQVMSQLSNTNYNQCSPFTAP